MLSSRTTKKRLANLESEWDVADDCQTVPGQPAVLQREAEPAQRQAGVHAGPRHQQQQQRSDYNNDDDDYASQEEKEDVATVWLKLVEDLELRNSSTNALSFDDADDSDDDDGPAAAAAATVAMPGM